MGLSNSDDQMIGRADSVNDANMGARRPAKSPRSRSVRCRHLGSQSAIGAGVLAYSLPKPSPTDCAGFKFRVLEPGSEPLQVFTSPACT